MAAVSPLSLSCRTYEWIVKGGEDVRMDERMEQLLGVANGLLKRHPGAASHGLQVGAPHAGASLARKLLFTGPG